MKQILIILFSILLVSCCETTYKLQEYDIAFNPYHVGDTLIFKSNTGDRDTIFILEINRRKYLTNYLTSVHNCTEHLFVYTKSSGPKTRSRGRWYLENNFLKINKWRQDDVTIDFNLAAKDARFLGGYNISLAEIKNKPVTEIKIDSIVYKDIIVINSDYSKNKRRNNFIDKIYWSFKLGYIKFELHNGTVWQLEKKYGR